MKRKSAGDEVKKEDDTTNVINREPNSDTEVEPIKRAKSGSSQTNSGDVVLTKQGKGSKWTAEQLEALFRAATRGATSLKAFEDQVPGRTANQAYQTWRWGKQSDESDARMTIQPFLLDVLRNRAGSGGGVVKND